METRYSLDRDLSEARAMVENLESYLLGDELYGSVGGMFGGDPDMPSLTVGALLLRINRLHKLADLMAFDQRAILTDIEVEHDRLRGLWSDAYMRKAHREAGARLHSLEAYFAECEDSPGACAGDYLPEALRRTMLEEIVDALSKHNMPMIDLPRSLQEHDAQLHRFTQPSTFIWDNELKAAYPQNKYWWLYHRPQVEEREQQQR